MTKVWYGAMPPAERWPSSRVTAVGEAARVSEARPDCSGIVAIC